MGDDAAENPLTKLLNGELSEYDFGVLEHGFAPHGRDYTFVIQDSLCNDPGTVTAEVAGSSPVVPAIHSKRLTG